MNEFEREHTETLGYFVPCKYPKIRLLSIKSQAINKAMIEGFVHGCRKAEKPSVNSLICNYNYNTKLYTYNQEEKTLTLSLGTKMNGGIDVVQ